MQEVELKVALILVVVLALQTGLLMEANLRLNLGLPRVLELLANNFS